jgi:hypothetical protein
MDPLTGSITMRFGPNKDYILETDGGSLGLSLAGEREVVKIGVSKEYIMVEVRSCACLGLSRSL